MKKTNPLRLKTKRFRLSKLYTCMLLALPATYAHAQSEGIYEWNGNINNSVSESGNWSYIGQDLENPYNSQAIINSNSSVNGEVPTWVVESGNGVEVAPGYYATSVKIGFGDGSNGVLTVKQAPFDENSPWVNSFLSSISVGTQGGTGTLNIVGDEEYFKAGGSLKTLDIYGDDALLIGAGSGSHGTVNILGSGKTTQMQNDRGAILSVSKWNEDADILIGSDGGKGSLNIDGGSVLFEAYQSQLLLGSGTGSQGTLNILGGGKMAHNVSTQSMHQDGIAFVVGAQGGHGRMNISGYSPTNNAISRATLGTGITIGQGNNSLGEVYISQGAQLVTGTAPYWDNITGEEHSTLNQIGVDNGSGYVAIDGQNSIWKVLGHTYFMGSGMAGEVGELYVGQSGSGEITLSNGGKLSIGQAEYSYIDDSDYENNRYNYYYGEQNYTGGLGTLYLANENGSTGTINIGAPAGQTAQGTGILDVKDIQFGEGSGTIVFNHTDNSGNYTFDTPLISGNGQGIIRQIAGTTILADQPNYTGDISVEGGKLLINGTQTIDQGRISGGIFEVNGDYTANDTQVTGGYFELLGRANSPITVSQQGTLSGNGTVTGNVTINAGGTVSPGTALGETLDTLTVGSLTFNQGSIYQANSNPDATSDLLYATSAQGSGTVTINGGTVNVIAQPGTWKDETKYHIIKTDEGLTGTFDGVSTNLAFLEPSLEYDPANAYLYLKRNGTSFGSIGNTYNQRSAGKGIEGLRPGNPVYDTVVSMSREQALYAYDNLSGEIHADVKSAMLSNSRYSRLAVNQHLSGKHDRQQDPEKNLWINTWAHNGHIKADGNAARLNNQGIGFLVGMDAYSNGMTTLGIAAGYEQTKLKAGELRNSDAKTEAFHLLGYGSTTLGSVDLKGGLGYSWLDVDTTRHITVPGLENKNTAKYHGDMIQAFGEISHTFELNDQIALTPYADINYQRVRIKNFTERGNATALQHRSQNVDQLSSTIGVRGKWTPSEHTQLDAGLGWMHRYNSQTIDTDLSFIGATNTFNVRAPRNAQDSALLELGVTLTPKNNMRLRIGYSGEYSNRGKDHAAHVLWELKF